MARNRGVTQQGTSVIIPDWMPTDTAPSLRDQLKEKYGENLEYTNIYLHRLDENNAGKQPVFVQKYSDPPEVSDVQDQHGGGYYELKIQWNDPNTESGRNMYKTRFRIEGDPKKNNAENKPAAAAPGQSKTDILTEIKAYKDLFGAGDDKSGFGNLIALIIQTSKSADEKMLKMFETLGKNNSNGINETILTTLLTAALQKANPLTELTGIKDVIEMVQGLTGSGTGEKPGMAETLINAIAPALLGPKRGPAMPVNGSMAPVRQLPSPDQNTALIQQMAAKIDKLEKELHYSNLSDDELDKFESGINTLGHEKNYAKCVSEGMITDLADYNEWIKICNNRNAENDDETIIPFYEPAAANENQNNITDMSSIVEMLKNATPEVKIAQLKMYYNTLGHVKTFNWCYENGVIDNSSYENALIAYNTWCRSAGIEEYKP